MNFEVTSVTSNIRHTTLYYDDVLEVLGFFVDYFTLDALLIMQNHIDGLSTPNILMQWISMVILRRVSMGICGRMIFGISMIIQSFKMILQCQRKNSAVLELNFMMFASSPTMCDRCLKGL